MRIISGKLKGREIKVPKSFQGRPTTDFARVGLFNMLQHQIDFSTVRVLDLFSGTGAFSLECFSRGAKDITAVEKNPLHRQAIREHFIRFGATTARTIQSDVLIFIEKKQPPFDLIFADPPFDWPMLADLLNKIKHSGLLAENGIFILEHSEKYDFNTADDFIQHRRYANVNFTFFRHLPQ